MMNGRPSDPEYCQNIYEAAKRVVEFYNPEYVGKFCYQLDEKMENLKRALEGKENV